MVKRCAKCFLEKEDFYLSYKGLHSWCKGCCSERAAERYKANPESFRQRHIKSRSDVRKALLEAAQNRANKYNLPIDITLEDIVVPEYCPILNIKLERGVGRSQSTSPSLDKIDPLLGYVKNNIQVISNKANMMKHNATKEELKMFAKWIGETFGY